MTAQFIKIDQHHRPGMFLGRHVRHDEASKEFPAEKAPQIIDTVHVATGLPLDQGNVGSCTANALCGALDSAPNFRAGTTKGLDETDAQNVYHVETELEGDPWPPNDPGGSGLMVCKAGRQLGLVRAYHHAFGIDHALHALVLRPVIFGFAWYASFFNPDPQTAVISSIPAGDTIEGGHEICADEINVSAKLIGFWNSWGTSWGKGGKFYMTWDVVEQLLAQQGDATVPIPA